MKKRIHMALAALAIAFATAFSAGAFGFSQTDVAGIRPQPKDGTPAVAMMIEPAMCPKGCGKG